MGRYSHHWTEAQYYAYLAQHGRAADSVQEGTPVPERAFQHAVRKMALQGGWLFYHTYDARKSDAGFFDCVCAKPGYPLILAELKAATGVLTVEQQHWHDTVAHVAAVECYIWRPEDMAEIVSKLLQK